MTRFNRRGLLAGATLLAAPRLARAAEAVRIGLVDSFSGAAASLARSSFEGATLAAESVNAAGGIKALGGRPLELVRYDTQGSVQTGQAVAERAIQDGVTAIIGSSQSSVTLATTTAAERAGVPHIVNGSAASQITQRGYRYTFRVLVTSYQSGPQSIEGYQMLFADAGRPLRKILVLYEDTAYGQSGFASMSELAPARGIACAGIAFRTGSPDLSSLVARARQEGGDVLSYIGYTNDAITLVTAMKEANANFPLLNLATGPTDPLFVRAVDMRDVEGVTTVKYFDPDVRPPGNEDGPRRFAALYQERFGPVGYLGGQGWSCVKIVAKALETAGSADRTALRDALAQVELLPQDGHILPYRSIRFDETGQNIHANVPLAQVQDGRTPLVLPKDFAVAPARIPMPSWAEKRRRR